MASSNLCRLTTGGCGGNSADSEEMVKGEK